MVFVRPEGGLADELPAAYAAIADRRPDSLPMTDRFVWATQHSVGDRLAQDLRIVFLQGSDYCGGHRLEVKATFRSMPRADLHHPVCQDCLGEYRGGADPVFCAVGIRLIPLTLPLESAPAHHSNE